MKQKTITWDFIRERIKVGFYFLESFLASLVLLMGCSRASRQTANRLDTGELKSWEVVDNALVLRFEKWTGRVAFVNGGSLWMTVEYGTNLTERYSYAVNERKILIAPAVTDNGDTLSFGSDAGLKVVVAKNRFETVVYDRGREIYRFVPLVSTNADRITIRATYRGERFFGLGEKTGDFELTGRSFTMYNSDTYKYGETTDPIYASIPFFLAVAPEYSYGAFFDNPARSFFNMTSTNYAYTVMDRRVEFYIFAGGEGMDEFKTVIGSYSGLTGKPYMPPLYGFGFHQSRYSYTNQAQVLWVANQFRANDLPLDVIYLDIGFMSNKMAFTYDHQAYPDPALMNKKLLALGVRSVAIVDPGIKVDTNYSVCQEGLEQDVFVHYKDRLYKGAVWPGMCYFPDFTKESTQKWWEAQYKTLLALGIEGYWNDMNEPSVFNEPGVTMRDLAVQDNHGSPTEHKNIHNIYGFSMIRATYTGLSNLNPGRRVFLLTRSAYAGAQRYAFIWTGDNSSMWKHLRMNVSMAMNIGISGMPYVGADIGGYTGAPTPELFVRWIQLGTFMPFMRDHTEAGTPMQEPYVFGAHLDTIRRYLKLRYRLLPYLYTEAYRAHTTGTPILKPLFLEYGRETLDIDEEFLFGSAMLVAPVLEKSVTNLKVTLPGSGTWYDYMSGESRAPGTINAPVTLEDIPVYVRGGTMLPTYETGYRSTMEIRSGAEVVWVVYPDSDGRAAGTLYEDDGISMDYSRGKYALTEASYSQAGDKAEIKFAIAEGGLRPSGKFVFVVPPTVKTVTVNGRNVAVSNGRVVVTR